MPASKILGRAPRSTRAMLVIAEAQQSEVIDHLFTMGEDRLADRLQRCQDARLHRQPNVWPWRCRSSGCWSCRRTTMRRWWRGGLLWLSGPDTSLAIIPLDSTDLIPMIRRLRKSLRDVRDRTARIHARWAAVAMGGIVSDADQLMIIVGHAGIDREALWDVFERRWPNIIIISDLGDVPTSTLTVDATIRLAVARRGIEPIRIVVPAQHPADPGWDDDAMPVVV